MSFQAHLPRLASQLLNPIAVAMVLCSLAGISRAADLATPAGLNPGDQFRFLFITGNGSTATSSDLSTYDAFVTTEAGNATYAGGAITWRAVVSSSTVDARDHVNPSAIDTSVYLANGVKVADDMTAAGSGLWSANLLANPDIKIDGTQLSFPTVYSWSGSKNDGTKFAGFEMGTTTTVHAGYFADGQTWLDDSTNRTSTFSYPLFGLSDPLTVAPVPEPASLGLAAAGLAGAALAFRHRAARKS
jgi:hypothetical protein